MNRIPVTLVGRGASGALARMRDGHILAAFQRSCYLETDRAELVCLGAAAIGAGPLNALCELPDAHASWSLAPGVRAEKCGGELRLGADVAVNLAGARLWQPLPAGAPRARAALHSALAELADLVPRRQDVRGFGAFIPALLGRDVMPGVAAGDPLFVSSWEAVRTFTGWLRQMSFERENDAVVPERAKVLVGLGPGLTPAGDDFLGGVMIALRWLREDALAGRIAAWVLPLARARTSKISRAHLRCAADGEGAAALHDLLAAFGSSQRGRLAAPVDALDSIGHSSGWDALAGIVCACSTLVHPHRGS